MHCRSHSFINFKKEDISDLFKLTFKNAGYPASIVKPPPELFGKFCSFLPPADLFTLSQVCRKFREYLCAPNSFSTQQIWKRTRLQFMPKEKMPPPEGMSEEEYVELLMVEQGCQVCKRNKECKVYWEFRIRCCEKC